jgi:hypothetical protein
MQLRGIGLRGVIGRGAVLGVLLALAACSTRSISDSGYQGNSGYRGAGNPFYKGELSAYDVLGVDSPAGFSDAAIRDAMVTKQRIVVPKGSAVLLIQSGAILPDPGMISAMERYYTVSSFSGVPLRDTRFASAPTQSPAIPYSQLFRMAAAKGGYETVIVYWGMLEAAQEGMGGKAISWIPIIGGVIPDENQHMRIRLMVAVIDTRTGQWESFSPRPAEDEAISTEHGRAASDQRQVALLKAKAYQDAADDLALRFSR